jgi:hypothetical protein
LCLPLSLSREADGPSFGHYRNDSVLSMSLLIKTEMYSLESRSSVRDPNSVLWNMSSCPSSLARHKIFLNTCFHGLAWAGSWQTMVTNKDKLLHVMCCAGSRQDKIFDTSLVLHKRTCLLRAFVPFPRWPLRCIFPPALPFLWPSPIAAAQIAVRGHGRPSPV